MALYYWITIWLFALLLFGLMPDSVCVAEIWPDRSREERAKRFKQIVFIISSASFLVLWFLTAFRSISIGTDTQNYVMYFNYFSRGVDKSIGVEAGYQYLCYFISKITNNSHTFLIVISTIMYGGVGPYLFKYSKNTAVSLCLFYSFFFSVFASILRQGIAMVIALYGYLLLKDGKKIAAALVFLLATFFHTTAIVCFLLFADFEFFKRQWLVLTLTVICAIISFSGVLKVAINTIVPRYTHYFEGMYASSGRLAITCYLLLYMAFYYLISRSLIADYKPDRVVATNFTLLLVLTAFGYAVNLFERAGEYFMLIAVAEIPNMLYRGKVKHFRLWLLGICAVTLIMFILILIYRPGWSHLYPYEFWH